MKTMTELKNLWRQLGDIPINNNEKIDKGFLHFPRGTHREEIWHWFEDQNKEFSVGKAMVGTSTALTSDLRNGLTADGHPLNGYR